MVLTFISLFTNNHMNSNKSNLIQMKNNFIQSQQNYVLQNKIQSYCNFQKGNLTIRIQFYYTVCKSSFK